MFVEDVVCGVLRVLGMLVFSVVWILRCLFLWIACGCVFDLRLSWCFGWCCAGLL